LNWLDWSSLYWFSWSWYWSRINNNGFSHGGSNFSLNWFGWGSCNWFGWSSFNRLGWNGFNWLGWSNWSGLDVMNDWSFNFLSWDWSLNRFNWSSNSFWNSLYWGLNWFHRCWCSNLYWFCDSNINWLWFPWYDMYIWNIFIIINFNSWKKVNLFILDLCL